jgi:3-hydroxyisobutyrate dehydrogenase
MCVTPHPVHTSGNFAAMNVSFLGLGAIGAPMAAHLAPPATELTVWNRTRERGEAFAARTGARLASTPADAVREADVVITCLPTSREVEILLDGADGMLSAMRKGALLLDCTSGDPTASRRISVLLEEHDVGFLDAPVSGGVSGAEKAALTIMVGGDPDLLERARPVLGLLGQKIVHVGPVGAGHALKAVNNSLLASHIWSLAEGLLALERFGVQPAAALDVINASSGRSNTSENLFPQRVLTRAFPRTFRLALLDKDVGIAASMAREARLPAPLLQLTSEMFRAAHTALGEEADHVEAVRFLEIIAHAGIGVDDADAGMRRAASPSGVRNV